MRIITDKQSRILRGCHNRVKNLYLNRRKRDDPYISVVLPVYNNSKYLEECIDSVLKQTYERYDLVIVDDKSTEVKTLEILKKLEKKKLDRVSIYYNSYNCGISETLNRAIIKAKGEYVAFLDCDDKLPANSLERVAEKIKRNPWVVFFYSNRKHIDKNSKIIGREDFSGRNHDNVKDDLLVGMFTSHLKVVKRVAFLNIGLNESRYDTAQDYDMALKLSEKFKTCFINEDLYYHRIHSKQQTQLQSEKQAHLAEEIKEVALRRRKVYSGEGVGLTSIIIVSFNRREDIARCLESIDCFTKLPHEIIIVDNGSSWETVAYLKTAQQKRENLRVIFEETNLGCSGGRKKGLESARGEFLVTLDNDMEVSANWLEELILRVTEDDKIMGACCKTVFPNCVVQFNGAFSEKVNDKMISFRLFQSGKSMLDLETTRKIECDWIPGGATIFKRAVLDLAKMDDAFVNAFEDNDYSLQVTKGGYRLVNCPLSVVIHHHIFQNANYKQEQKYLEARYDNKNILKSYVAFY